MTRPELEKGEKLLREIASDSTRYWRDNAVLALVGMAGLGAVLFAIGSPYPAIGALGAPMAIGVRAAYLASEQLGYRWWLTDRRMLLPGGRSVGLMELATVRRLMGDIQLITRSGDKHLMRHIPEPAAVVAEIEAARARRAKRART
jgi:hypothetical protein